MKQRDPNRLPPALLEPLEARVLLSAPQATLAADDITAGGTRAYTFVVEYESDIALNLNSLDTGDIMVTGPNGYSRTARLMGVINTVNPLAVSAVYRIEAPGNNWDPTDDGVYNIGLVAGEVANTAAETNAAAALGSFNVSAAGNSLNIDTPRILGTLTEFTVLTNLNTVSIPIRRFEFTMTGTGTKDHFIQLDFADGEAIPSIRLLRRLNGSFQRAGSVTRNKATFNTDDTASRRVSLKDVTAGTYILEIDSRNSTPTRGEAAYSTEDAYAPFTVSRRNPQFSLAINPATAPTPDLLAATLTTAGTPATLVPGDAIKARLVITNIGAGKARGSTNIELYLSTDQTLDGNDVLVGTDATRTTVSSKGHTSVKFQSNDYTIAAGKSRTVSITGTAPSNLAAGSYFLIARVQTGDLMPEVSTANNVIASAAAFDFTHSFGAFAGRTGVPMRYLESDGTEVTVKLTGPGSGQLTFNAGVPSIVLAGTTSASRLTITTRFGFNLWRIEDLIVPDSIGTVTATTTTLLGAANVTGTLGSAKFKNVTLP